jgi:hypothetical protein
MNFFMLLIFKYKRKIQKFIYTHQSNCDVMGKCIKPINNISSKELQLF